MPCKTIWETTPSTGIIEAQERVQHLPLPLPYVNVGATVKSYRSNDRRSMFGGGGGGAEWVCIT